MVVRKRRQEHIGHACARVLTQKDIGIVGDRLVQRGTEFLPVGKEFGQRLGVHDGTRQNVCAGFRTFFQNHHGDIRALFCGQLLQANGCCQPTGASTYDNHVVFHGLAGAKLGQNFLVGHGCLA